MKNFLIQKKRFEKKNLELNTLLNMDIKMIKIKISQFGKKPKEKNLNIEEGFKKSFFIRVKRENL